MRCSRPSASASAPALVLPLALLALACVSRGAHREVVAERDVLADRVALLERSNESLSRERIDLMEEVEDLRVQSASLSEEVRALELHRDDLRAGLHAREAELRAREKELGALRGTYDGLVADLEAEVAQGQVQIEQLRDGLRLNLSQEVLFPLGSARLNAQGNAVLRRVAGRLSEIEHRVEVQGHTDDLPIGGALAERYPSNWELAAARATEVVRLLEGQGVVGERLAAVSFGPFHPIASNATPEGRARNRRIEIRLLPLGEPIREPPTAPAASDS